MAKRKPTGNALFESLRALMAEDDFREPYATAAEAEAAALERTPRGEREGLELLRLEVPAGVYVQPDSDDPGVLGPLSWYDYGDPEEAAEEYGIDRRHVQVIRVYTGGKWVSA